MNVLIITEYWTNCSLRNKAHLLLAESGFFYRKFEMLNRMRDVTHQINAKKNLNSAILRAESILHLGDVRDMKEIAQAEIYLRIMKAKPSYKKSALSHDWGAQRHKLTDQSSSDLTDPLSSDPEVRATTAAQEFQKVRHDQAKIQIQAQLAEEVDLLDADSDRDM